MTLSDMAYIDRCVNLEALLKQKSYFLLGPRQTGKSSLIHHSFPRAKVYNLLDNAIRYTQNAGCVTLSINLTDEDVELIVADNGPGISMADRDKIFDRFHRVIGSGQDGSGLGLAIVKEIANLHNADIVVSEANSTNGLQVTVSFSKWMES